MIKESFAFPLSFKTLDRIFPEDIVRGLIRMAEDAELCAGLRKQTQHQVLKFPDLEEEGRMIMKTLEQAAGKRAPDFKG